MPFPRLPINGSISKRRSLRRPVLYSNLIDLRALSQAERESCFKYERDWQARTTERLFYDRILGQIVEYGYLLIQAPSASSLLNHCFGKAPEHTSSSDTGESVAGPSRLANRLGSRPQTTDEDDEDVLIYCPECWTYRPLEHLCYLKHISPEY
ncbi:hypothetical protein M422DRAFT_266868 [Sphaerobolus stellatus SS14]|uniref:Uncharacterized protein n=1 Tax=Sphaerobolus stellatus (strain SS14) TaxID=990650 RepID=A0A0C9V1P6_SPHS4|nr:hypothetical protein M422DRAFT_266868 [Sphaerobolus stellatus SS14]